MKKALVCFLFVSSMLCENSAQKLSYSCGFSYIFQYPNGPNISNNALPNAEGKISYSFINAEYLKINAGIGVATHNFLLKDISENRTYSYFRAEPFASLSIIGCLSEENNFLVHGIYAGVRAGFFNQWNFNPSWQAGLISKPFGKVRFYMQFSKLLYYSIPDNNYLLFDFKDNYYPLGNERWSITAGVQFGFRKKKE
ncbi:MAG: hypothetical protein A2W93_05350 [Bacteroidetes bacterium GWF2_43_63]|nr:MAG: hypothetical protein A2W94_11800 [Bacteroidetes bacterium GWE2_42_42]OFY56300.1 MAG: hypothetical protein A2W93_05350 [Bacteroidetes bacterium GWF2_43_63]HBG71980.1 hypothetical protein [Bacteroidales bacterium]HCB61881.1 hypothetical protein [Bacteroidales bacterium]HCY23903.1 hypothetical protein [Bacteroidales bacterium]